MDTDFGGGVGEVEWGSEWGWSGAGSLGGDCELSVGQVRVRVRVRGRVRMDRLTPWGAMLW